MNRGGQLGGHSLCTEFFLEEAEFDEDPGIAQELVGRLELESEEQIINSKIAILKELIKRQITVLHISRLRRLYVGRFETQPVKGSHSVCSSKCVQRVAFLLVDETYLHPLCLHPHPNHACD